MTRLLLLAAALCAEPRAVAVELNATVVPVHPEPVPATARWHRDRWLLRGWLLVDDVSSHALRVELQWSEFGAPLPHTVLPLE